jgi:hypothetical protein
LLVALAGVVALAAVLVVVAELAVISQRQILLFLLLPQSQWAVAVREDQARLTAQMEAILFLALSLRMVAVVAAVVRTQAVTAVLVAEVQFDHLDL